LCLTTQYGRAQGGSSALLTAVFDRRQNVLCINYLELGVTRQQCLRQRRHRPCTVYSSAAFGARAKVQRYILRRRPAKRHARCISNPITPGALHVSNTRKSLLVMWPPRLRWAAGFRIPSRIESRGGRQLWNRPHKSKTAGGVGWRLASSRGSRPETWAPAGQWGHPRLPCSWIRISNHHRRDCNHPADRPPPIGVCGWAGEEHETRQRQRTDNGSPLCPTTHLELPNAAHAKRANPASSHAAMAVSGHLIHRLLFRVF
jgi:hypothetical protein